MSVDWKEKLNQTDFGITLNKKPLDKLAVFISTQIIEKLIEELEVMSDEDVDGRKIEKVAEHFGVPVSVAANRRLDLKIEELKAKWLGGHND